MSTARGATSAPTASAGWSTRRAPASQRRRRGAPSGPGIVALSLVMRGRCLRGSDEILGGSPCWADTVPGRVVDSAIIPAGSVAPSATDARLFQSRARPSTRMRFVSSSHAMLANLPAAAAQPGRHNGPEGSPPRSDRSRAPTGDTPTAPGRLRFARDGHPDSGRAECGSAGARGGHPPTVCRAAASRRSAGSVEPCVAKCKPACDPRQGCVRYRHEPATT